jgi:hypothetical protein
MTATMPETEQTDGEIKASASGDERWGRIRHALKVNTSLRITPDVFADAREWSDVEGLSLNQYFEEAIRARNAANKSNPPTPARRTQPIAGR